MTSTRAAAPVRTLVRVLACALTCAAAAAARAQSLPSNAEAAFHATTLQLNAAGESHLAPDTAVLTLGVQSDAASAAEAARLNAGRMAAIMAAISRDGIAARDVQTFGLNLMARYGGEHNDQLIGFTAAETVAIRIRALPRVSAVLDDSVAAGANRVEGVEFSASERTAAEDEARQAAVRALQAKADLYARATGYRVLRLVSLNEGAVMRPARINEIALAAVRKGAPTPVAPGELTVQVEVNAVYELAR